LKARHQALTEAEMKNYIDKAMSYAEYIKLIDDLLLDGKTTGPKRPSLSMLSLAAPPRGSNGK
jgi:hypothetical protein